MIAVGRDGTITGRPAEGILIDDPLKNRKEADSLIILDSLNNLWEAVIRPRLAPLAFVILIMTRWAEKDLAGRFESEGWPVVNIPALADGKAPDALGRPVGTYMISARGRTEQEWRQIRADVGEREWAALYQGMPAPPGGTWFQQAWFDRDRVTEAPADCLPPIVYVDPADNTGGGDEAGVIIGRVDAKRHVYVGPDYTQIATMAQWVRIALLAAVRHGAVALAYERSLSGLPKAIREGWSSLRQQAIELQRASGAGETAWPASPDQEAITSAMAVLVREDDTPETHDEVLAEVMELWPYVHKVLAYPQDGPQRRTITPRGTKLFRIMSASPALQNRRVHVIGKLPEMEHEAVTWLPGKPSPNRLDTLVHMIHDLGGAVPATLSKPERQQGQLPTRSARSGYSAMIYRSARR